MALSSRRTDVERDSASESGRFRPAREGAIVEEKAASSLLYAGLLTHGTVSASRRGFGLRQKEVMPRADGCVRQGDEVGSRCDRRLLKVGSYQADQRRRDRC